MRSRCWAQGEVADEWEGVCLIKRSPRTQTENSKGVDLCGFSSRLSWVSTEDKSSDKM